MLLIDWKLYLDWEFYYDSGFEIAPKSLVTDILDYIRFGYEEDYFFDTPIDYIAEALSEAKDITKEEISTLEKFSILPDINHSQIYYICREILSQHNIDEYPSIKRSLEEYVNTVTNDKFI